MKKGKLYMVCGKTNKTPLFLEPTKSAVGFRVLGEVVDHINHGECFIFLETDEQYYKVIFKSKIGYITSKIDCMLVTKEVANLLKQTSSLV
jgi:hypothetical protein